MKNILLPLSVMLMTTVGVNPARAQAAPLPAPTTVSVTAGAAVVSQYMFRGLRLAGAAVQPSVEVTAGALTVGAWANTPFDADKVPDSSDPEIDLYGAYAIPVEGSTTVTVGFTSYHYPKAPTDAGYYRSTFEPSLALSGTIDGVKLTPKVYFDTVLKGFTYELSAAYALPLQGIGTELDFLATAGTYKWKDSTNHAPADVKTWGDYWLLGLSVPYQLSREARVSLGLAYTEGRNAYTKAGTLGRAANPLAIGRAVVTLGLAWTF